MRKWICLLLALTLCFGLFGCSTAENEGTTEPSTQIDIGTIESRPLRPAIPPKDEDKETLLSWTNDGCARVPYSTAISTVRYITAASQLPDYEALSKYDEEFFATKALVLVMETVRSGSVEVGIEKIVIEGSLAKVTLSHEAQGDASTPVMAAWLVWVEVERDLDYRWEVTNPAMESENQTH